jgi:succinoglycan biosynthesis protein ExoM
MNIGHQESAESLDGLNMPALEDSSRQAKPHICVCICTYKRPDMLLRLLNDLKKQETQDQFTYSIVVADNDAARSAESAVAEFATSSAIPIRYCVEPRQNISLARNKVTENADGEFVALIDDDEFPRGDWLLNLLLACRRFDVDGVLGPVLPYFDQQPPAWVVRGKFYEHATEPTGTTVEWQMARTGNVLLRRAIFDGAEPPFRPEFRGGEDQDFFRRMIEEGHKFVWCNEAVAYEVVPPARWRRKYLLQKALLRGTIARLQPTCGPLNMAKSAAAVVVYLAFLPVALIIGHHRFMDLSVRLCDHLGKLLAFAGFNPIKAPYIVN